MTRYYRTPIGQIYRAHSERDVEFWRVEDECWWASCWTVADIANDPSFFARVSSLRAWLLRLRQTWRHKRAVRRVVRMREGA